MSLKLASDFAKQITESDLCQEARNLAYVAGIIDGEGSISIGKQKQGKYDSLTVQINVANSQPLLVYWLQQFFDCGFIVKRKDESRPNTRMMYWWVVRSQKAVKQVVERVYPYLFLKKRQAQLCLILQTIRETMPSPCQEGKYHRFHSQPPELLEIKEKIRQKMVEANKLVL